MSAVIKVIKQILQLAVMAAASFYAIKYSYKYGRRWENDGVEFPFPDVLLFVRYLFPVGTLSGVILNLIPINAASVGWMAGAAYGFYLYVLQKS